MRSSEASGGGRSVAKGCALAAGTGALVIAGVVLIFGAIIVLTIGSWDFDLDFGRSPGKGRQSRRLAVAVTPASRLRPGQQVRVTSRSFGAQQLVGVVTCLARGRHQAPRGRCLRQGPGQPLPHRLGRSPRRQVPSTSDHHRRFTRLRLRQSTRSLPRRRRERRQLQRLRREAGSFPVRPTCRRPRRAVHAEGEQQPEGSGCARPGQCHRVSRSWSTPLASNQVNPW